MTQPTPAEIRKFISDYFNDIELETLCFDYFRVVKNEFTRGMLKSEKIIFLIEWCENQGKYEDLVAAVERERPTVFLNTFGQQASPKPKPDLAVSPPTYQPPVRNRKQIFLSHSSDDAPLAHQIATNLRQNNWQVWIAPYSIAPGEKWVEAIQRGLDESGIFILLMTPSAVKSRWVRSETNSAISLEHKGQMRLIPLMVKPTQTPSLWSSYQAIKFPTFKDEYFQNLISVLNGQSSYAYSANKPVEQPIPAAHETLDLADLYLLADEAIHAGDTKEAVRKFSQIAEQDPDSFWGSKAQDEINRIMFEEDRKTAYDKIEALVGRSKRIGKLDWEDFKKKYPNFDPDDIENLLISRMFSEDRLKRLESTKISSPKFESVKNLDLEVNTAFSLPYPFEWIQIPDKGYRIGKYPITNGQFALFVKDGGYKTDKWWMAEGYEYGNYRNWEEPRCWKGKRFSGELKPVVGVSWFEAMAFCNWLGDKLGQKVILPTEEEWQYAAQGDDGRTYPWGNEWDSNRCNNNLWWQGVRQTTPVTEFEQSGVSPFGVVDMSGNVWEWCLKNYYDEGANVIDYNALYQQLRGGSWYNIFGYHFVVWHRYPFNSYRRFSNFGFRVVMH